MARKRGGVAGFWDRNKGAIKTAVPMALSFVPGVGIPLAAGSRALMEGLDRPGKSGIGFDPFAGMEGGVKGAAIAAGTQGARALLTGGGPMAGTVPKIGGRAASAVTQNPLGNFPMGIGPELGGTTGGATPQKSMSWKDAFKQPQVLAGGVQGLLGMLPDAKSAAMAEQTKLGQGQLDLQKAQFEEEKRRADMEQERKRKIAELLMPLMQQSFGQYYGGGR